MERARPPLSAKPSPPPSPRLPPMQCGPPAPGPHRV
jgi:hypothetical protein